MMDVRLGSVAKFPATLIFTLGLSLTLGIASEPGEPDFSNTTSLKLKMFSPDELRPMLNMYQGHVKATLLKDKLHLASWPNASKSAQGKASLSNLRNPFDPGL